MPAIAELRFFLRMSAATKSCWNAEHAFTSKARQLVRLAKPEYPN